jgi:hypothetical protein
MPNLYALMTWGDCMEPLYEDGQPLLFSKREPWKSGDVVAIYLKPEAIPEDESPVPLLKRLISSPPPCFFTRGPTDSYGRPLGAVKGKLIARSLNPDQSVIIGTEYIWAIHKCLGALGSHDVLSAGN